MGAHRPPKLIQGTSLFRLISLGVVLFGTWLLMSGHYDPLLISLGLASTVLTVYLAHRMDMIDHEGHPVHLGWAASFYWLWLGWEIVKSNIGVAKIILSPSLPINPNMINVKALQKSEMGRVIFANSITLTPGTVSVQLEEDGMIEVHAITYGLGEDVLEGTMNRKVASMMDSEYQARLEQESAQ